MKNWIMGISVLLSTIFIGCEKVLQTEEYALTPTNLKSADLAISDGIAYAKPSIQQGGYVFVDGTKIKSNPEQYPMLYLTKNSWGWAANISINEFNDRMKDIEGNIYRTVTIGNQIWMAENLKTSLYNDGEPIQYHTGFRSLYPEYAWYDNDITNKSIYGALYNFSAVNTGKLSPTGWHIPTDSEWSELINFAGGSSIAGGKLKSTTADWVSPNLGATDEYGFSVLPAGATQQYAYGFIYMGLGSAIWSSNPGITRNFDYNNTNAVRGTGYIDWVKNAVRCIKDDNHPAILHTDVEFPIYADAGLNNTSKGTLVGKAIVTYNGAKLTISYDLFEGFAMQEVHIYASDAQPATFIPGQFGFTQHFDPVVNDFETSFEIPDINGDGKIWCILNAKLSL